MNATIRPAREDDLPGILDIDNDAVLNTISRWASSSAAGSTSCTGSCSSTDHPRPSDNIAMRHSLLIRSLFILGAAALARGAEPAEASPPNTLTAAEQVAGWKLLFDGRTTAGWRGFNKPAFPDQGWIVGDGALKKVAGVRGGDIITAETFDDFELSWEWRIPPGANNGVKYFITEARGTAVGHEYQMIDDTRVKDPKGATASFYDVVPPKAGKRPPRIGEWNASRIVVHGNHVEHWLNGDKVLEYELGSPEVLAAVAKSKFKSVPGFGAKLRGHLLLTDHNDEAWFRNLKLRELPQPSPAAEGNVPTQR